jgi:hypothetical protein
MTTNPSLKQWDTEEIHDFYCEDIIYQNLEIDGEVIPAPDSVKFRNFLAVEKISINGQILFDFEAIALLYP